MSLATKKLSRLLRTHEQTLLDFEEAMEQLSGKKDVLDTVAEAHDARLSKALKDLNLSLDANAEQVHEALMEKIRENDDALNAYLDKPTATTAEGCGSIASLADRIAGTPRGYFLKRDVAERLFRQNPPQNLMRELGVDSIDELLEEYSLEELFPGIRFAEDAAWLNDVFFHPYGSLTPDDFEEREVKIVVLPKRFRDIGQRFAGKKLHHISHLKELGIIFVMPVSGEDHKAPVGSSLEVLTLVLHYLNEVPFYSRIFRRFAKERKSFAPKVISALRGDVLPQVPQRDQGRHRFLIVQRYLAKEDASDPRLFQPHANPEAIHWRLVEESLHHFAKEHPELGFTFWNGLGSVGEYFPYGGDQERYLERGVSSAVAISFDFIDNLISHNRHSPVLEKYLYHQQEALWNELFAAFLGLKRFEAMVEENLEKGYIEVD